MLSVFFLFFFNFILNLLIRFPRNMQQARLLLLLCPLFPWLPLTAHNASVKIVGGREGWLMTPARGYININKQRWLIKFLWYFCLVNSSSGASAPLPGPGASGAPLWGVLPPVRDTHTQQWEASAVFLLQVTCGCPGLVMSLLCFSPWLVGNIHLLGRAG